MLFLCPISYVDFNVPCSWISFYVSIVFELYSSLILDGFRVTLTPSLSRDALFLSSYYTVLLPIAHGLGFYCALILALGVPYCALYHSGLLGAKKGSYPCVRGAIPRF
jgi:hypothetical protein